MEHMLSRELLGDNARSNPEDPAYLQRSNLGKSCRPMTGKQHPKYSRKQVDAKTYPTFCDSKSKSSAIYDCHGDLCKSLETSSSNATSPSWPNNKSSILKKKGGVMDAGSFPPPHAAPQGAIHLDQRPGNISRIFRPQEKKSSAISSSTLALQGEAVRTKEEALSTGQLADPTTPTTQSSSFNSSTLTKNLSLLRLYLDEEEDDDDSYGILRFYIDDDEDDDSYACPLGLYLEEKSSYEWSKDEDDLSSGLDLYIEDDFDDNASYNDDSIDDEASFEC